MMGQGLGPGFTIVAKRMSVIFSFEGREFVLTLLGYASSESPASKAPPIAAAELFSTSRRANTCRPFLLITLCPPLGGNSRPTLPAPFERQLAALSRSFGRPELLKNRGPCARFTFDKWSLF